MTLLAPTTGSDRILALDALRGFALFGVFLVNLPFMAMPMDEVFSTPDVGTDSLPNVLAWFLDRAFGEMKFFTIFSFLFGMGLILQMQRAQASGRPFAGLYLRRLGWLAVMGLLHGTLFFFGDILFPYACVGLLLFLCRNLSPRKLVVVGVIGLAGGFLLTAGWSYTGFLEDMGAEAEGADTRSDGERIAYTEGPLSKTVLSRTFSYVGWLVFSTLISFNWRVVAMFFLGAAAMKAGLLGREHGALHRKVCTLGLLLGGGLEVAVVAGKLFGAPQSGFPGVAGGLANEVGSLLLSGGYIGAVILVVHSGVLRRLVYGLSCVGRMALTNYLTQSILGNLIFMWFGFGLWGEVSRAGLLGISTAVFALQIPFSVVWLRAFRIGPFEWVWRRLTYGRVSLR